MKTRSGVLTIRSRDYDAMLNRVAALIDEARRASARVVNALMTATYWSVGRHIVEFELSGKRRAEYGEELLVRMAADLTSRFGRGFSRQNLQQMRQFYQAFPFEPICQTASGKSLAARSIVSTPSRESVLAKSQTPSAELNAPSISSSLVRVRASALS